jgi:hypothetical protein
MDRALQGPRPVGWQDSIDLRRREIQFARRAGERHSSGNETSNGQRPYANLLILTTPFNRSMTPEVAQLVTGHPSIPHDFIVRLGALEEPTS